MCSTPKVDLIRSLGAGHVVDYYREDFTRSEERYDLILPNSGHGGMSYVFKAFALSLVSRRCARPFMAVPNHADLNLLKDYCEAGLLPSQPWG